MTTVVVKKREKAEGGIEGNGKMREKGGWRQRRLENEREGKVSVASAGE